LQVYGLSSWPVNKSVRDEGDLLKRIEDVPYRFRDVRRMGRGDGAQVIISNEELTQLIIDIFTALDTPLAIRRMRSLVLSKLAIEDFRPLSLDDGPPSVCEEGESFARRELPDERPTPLDLLLAKEATKNIEQVVEGLLQNLRNAVHNKPRRFAKLIAVASSCYFDPASPSQSAIARQMNISNSLVSHYRLIFDSCVHALNLTVDEYILLNEMLGHRLGTLKAESSHLVRRQPSVKRQRARSLPAMVEAVRPLAMVAASCNR
jgi:hypothetical protein